MWGPTRFPRAARGLSRNVLILSLVSMLADVSSELVYPLLPLFVVGTLGAPATAVGLIEGTAESIAAGLRLFAGWWSDRTRRRKPLIVAGYALAAVGKLLLALSFVWPMVLLARTVDRFGKGIRGAPRDALIADSSEPAVRGRAFGFHRSADTTGAVIGPLAALLLLTIGADLRLVFVVAFVPGVFSALFASRATDVVPTAPPRARPSLWAGDRRFVLFLVVVGVFSIGNSSDVFLLLRSADLGLSERSVVLAYVMYNVLYMLAALPLGSLSDRLGRAPVLVGGLLVFASVYAGFAFVDDVRWVWPLFAVYGIYIAATDGVTKALIVDIVPAEHRGAAIGAHGAVTAGAILIASLIAGILWDTVSTGAPFVLGAVCAMTAAALLPLVLRGAANDATA